MTLKSKVLIGAFSMVLVLSMATAVAIPAIAESSNKHSGSMADKIANKLNLKKEDVKAVFKEERQERQVERIAEVSQNLQEAVDSGKITSEQKSLIENKIKENQTARQSEIDSLTVWADQNSIDMRYVMGGGRHGNANNRLQTAVDNGDITAEQKAKIVAKQAELNDAREKKHDAMEQWAKDNNIDLEYLHIGKGQGHGGPGMRGGHTN